VKTIAKLCKIDDSNRHDHIRLSKNDQCYYFYEYTAYTAGESWSKSNQFIWNLKKEIGRKNENDYLYKLSAIKEAAQLLNTVFKNHANILSQAIICPIPPSKIKTDPYYDDRMTKVCQIACENIETTLCELIEQTKPYPSSHRQKEGERITVDNLKNIYKLSQRITQPFVIFIDDLITTGTHFIACKEVILEAHPTTKVFGLFIARRAII